MNEFEFYLGDGKVKKQSPDAELAKSLIADAADRFEKASGLDAEAYSKIIFEIVYDAIRDILDALLAADGYKSYSHEAYIAYLRKYGVEDSVIEELDNLRYRRNSSKYYGKGISAEDVAEIIDFYKRHSERWIKVVKDKISAKK